jgi:hypothetical protein
MLVTPLGRMMLLALVLLTACAKTPVGLVDYLTEGMREADAIAALGNRNAQFHVVYETSLPRGDPRPPYTEKTIAAAGVSCVWQPSDISMSFYLAQLSEVTCYPHDAGAMVDALARAGVITNRERKFSVTRGGVAIRGSEVGGRWSVTFSSLRLTEDQRRWVAKYS